MEGERTIRLSAEEINFLDGLAVEERREIDEENKLDEEHEEIDLTAMAEMKVEMTKFMGEMSYVTEYLFLGSAYNARSARVLREHGVTHVLNVARNCPQMNHPVRPISAECARLGDLSLTCCSRG